MKTQSALPIVLVVVALCLSGCSSYTEVDLQPGPGIPPDPGRKATNGTLLGVDSDSDGVRDDVQRYIMALDVDHPFFKRGLLQYAAAYQEMMGDKITEDNAYKGFYLIGRAVGCYYSAELQGGGREIIQYQKEVKRSQLNTFLRRMKVRRMEWLLEAALWGSSSSAQEDCDFDVELYSGERWR